MNAKLWLSLLLLVWFVPQEGMAGWTTLPKSSKQHISNTLHAKAQARRFALVVGINQSTRTREWPPLRYARRDALRMARALRRIARFDRIMVKRTPRQTTTRALLQALQKLRALATRKSDVVLVYVSAHGVVSKGRARYIVTSDTTRRVSKTGFAVARLRKILKAFSSRKVGLILATCYSGSIRSKAVRLPGAKGNLKPARRIKSRAIQILSAASFAQPAFESTRLKADIYTHFFLDCLRKLPHKSIIKIHTCATPKTTRYVQQWNGEIQVPKAYSVLGANRDFDLQASGKKLQKQGYFRAGLRGKRNLLYRIFRLGRKSNKTNAVAQTSEDEVTALAPGRYRIVVQSPKGQVLRQEELLIAANQVSALPSDWSLEWQAGFLRGTGALQEGGEWLGQGMFGVRHPWFALLFGLWGTTLTFEEQLYQQLALELRAELGYSFRVSFLEVFFGGFGAAGLVLQDLNREAHVGPWLQTGITFSTTFRLSSQWGIMVAADASLFPIAATRGRFLVAWGGGLRMGIRYRLGGS